MTKKILVKNVAIGGDAPVSVQSMTNTKTDNYAATAVQIAELATAGADIVRVTVPDEKSAESFGRLVKTSPVPLVADIHYDGRLALAALRQGAAKLRINPGNTPDNLLREIVSEAAQRHVPIRVGVNHGSLPGPCDSKSLVEACLATVKKIEDFGFYDMVLAVKSSDVCETISAYRLLHEKTAYPLHIGLTESGFGAYGLIKSSAAIGTLLSEGIGDTVRISLSGNPIQEVIYARKLLNCMGLRHDMPEIISCPTCGRTEIDVEGLAKKVVDWTISVKKPIKIAVMGCVVNGLGEGRDADVGIAGGKEHSIIFAKGEKLKTVNNEQLESEFFKVLGEVIK